MKLFPALECKMGSLSRIKKKLEKDNNNEQFASLVRTQGMSRMLTECEEQAICNGLVQTASRGFASDVQDLKIKAYSVANLSAKSFKKELPSDDCICSFRARHVTYLSKIMKERTTQSRPLRTFTIYKCMSGHCNMSERNTLVYLMTHGVYGTWKKRKCPGNL